MAQSVRNGTDGSAEQLDANNSEAEAGVTVYRSASKLRESRAGETVGSDTTPGVC